MPSFGKKYLDIHSQSFHIGREHEKLEKMNGRKIVVGGTYVSLFNFNSPCNVSNLGYDIRLDYPEGCRVEELEKEDIIKYLVTAVSPSRRFAKAVFLEKL